MAKFSIGNGSPPQFPLTPSQVPQRTQRTSQTRAKAPVGPAVRSPIDATETSGAGHNQSAEGLRNQVQTGLRKLELAYYGQDASESSLLKLMAPHAPDVDTVADHVLLRQSRMFAKDLGLTSDEARALVADLAVVLA